MKAKSLIALVLGAAALAPAARADVVDNSLTNYWAQRAAAQYDLSLAVPAQPVQNTVVPYLAQQYGITTSSVRPDDRAGIRGIPSPTNAQPVSTGSGFAWSDAGIGAAAAFGAMLVALGIALTVRRSQTLGY